MSQNELTDGLTRCRSYFLLELFSGSSPWSNTEFWQFL